MLLFDVASDDTKYIDTKIYLNSLWTHDQTTLFWNYVTET